MPFTPDQLHVIAVISNLRRYESRYKLYRIFEQYVEDSGATLYTVEAAFGERDHAITRSDNPTTSSCATRKRSGRRNGW